jgi:ribosomal protein S18 acetylase RimI-like enzyme
MIVEPPVLPLTADDADWFRAVWRKCEAQLGELWTTGGPTFHRWLRDENLRHRIDGIRPFAFVHYLIRVDGGRTIYDIAVDPEARGQGFGRRLVEHVGFPCRLSTNTDNAESNAFYRALGFRLVKRELAKTGHLKNVYERLR